jgi:uncharacterized repeat protein (TIGR02543 family)
VAFVKTYTVTWYADGGTPVPSPNTVSHGGEITEPTAMTKTGYTFGGWYTDSSFDTAADFPITATGNITLYAKWTLDSYAVTLNTNGGTGGTPLTSYTYGTGAPLPIDYTKTGYTFAGWYDNEGLTGTAVTEISATATGDKAFWAKWTEADYTVTLNLNGGTGGTLLAGYTYGTGATLPTDYTKTGYTFAGWYDNVELSGDAVTAITPTDTGNKAFWAKWTESDYTVTLNTNGGTGGTPLTTYTYGTGATLPTDYTKTGYTFAGWYDNVELSGEAVTAIAPTDTGNKAFWAKWTEADYTVTLNTNGGTGGTPLAGYTYGTGATLPTDYTKPGYTFAGWYDNAGLIGDAVTEISGTATGDKAFWAKWTDAAYTVTLHTNGGTGGTPLAGYTYGTGATLPIDYTKDGYTFAGWYDNEGLTGTTVTEISATAAGDKAFWAKWTEADYTVTLNTNGGTGGTPFTSYTYGTGATLPTDYTKDGYTFAGWYDNAGLTGDAVTAITPTDTGNKTFWAKWTESDYTVTLHTNGSTGGTPLAGYTYGTGATLPTY